MFSLNCQQYKITDEKTGETLKNFEIRKKGLIIADRAYATITGMEYCLENGGDFILRIRNKAFNLYNAEREQVFLTDWLKTLDGGASFVEIMKNEFGDTQLILSTHEDKIAAYIKYKFEKTNKKICMFNVQERLYSALL